MDFFSNFLQQKVPKSGKELPVYYRKALCVSEILLIAYFFVCFFFYPLFLDVWIWFPLGFAAVTGAALNVSQLDLEDGRVALEGEVDALEYTGGRKKGVLGRLFR